MQTLTRNIRMRHRKRKIAADGRIIATPLNTLPTCAATSEPAAMLHCNLVHLFAPARHTAPSSHHTATSK